MSDMSLYGPCEICHKHRFFIRKRLVPLPIGRTAKSQKKMCGKCYGAVLKMLETNHE